MNTVPEFTEALKFEYPLTDRSLVVDCGAYEGNWSLEMSRRYACRIFAFEPCKRFYDTARATLAGHANVVLFNLGVGELPGLRDLGVANDSTGVFCASKDRQRAHFINLPHFLKAVAPEFDVLKLNIEGGEYEILEAITAQPEVARRFKNILVQFHTCAPDYALRLEAIQTALARTHELAWGTNPFMWQSYAIKK